MGGSLVQQLYPPPQAEHPLEGLFLAHDLRSLGGDASPFVYSDFISSLDGRIAVEDKKGDLGVPKAIANDRDWRLFQELAAQADLLVTSGRYLRNYVAGKSQEILTPYDDPRFADLLAWRTERGLPVYPDLAVVSGSADFPLPAPLRNGDRRIHVVTAEKAGRKGLRALEGLAEIRFAGKETVDGKKMIRGFFKEEYRRIFFTTGPKVLHLLIAAGVLDRLYLTQTFAALGGDSFATIVEGARLKRPAEFRLSRLYFDPGGRADAGQLYSVYDRSA